MPEYPLYLESGPRRRRTMVHVLDLLGCVVRGPTTEEAIAATPDGVRAYLRFLRAHGEPVDPTASFTTPIAIHITEGPWLAEGDPVPGFALDFEPLAPADLAVYLNRIAGLGADLAALVRDVPPPALLAEPAGAGRTVFRIVEHIVEAQGAALRSTVGKVDELREALNAVHDPRGDLPAAIARVTDITVARLERMTEEEQTRVVPHGRVLWTARRGLRRILEHGWEHLQELSVRLPEPGV